MGTTGNGNFGNYIDRGRRECPDQISFYVEDFDSCSYYLSMSELPELNSSVCINDILINRRLVVIDESSSLIVGNVPSEYSYLYENCINQGKKYKGKIEYISSIPINKVLVELHVE